MKTQAEVLSYSKYNQHKECPYKFYVYNVTKEIKDVGNKFTVEGELWHKELELYVLRGEPLNLALPAQKMADHLVAMEGKKYCEIKVGCDENGNNVGDFFSEENFYRGILDFVCINGDTAFMVDWKVGKRKLSRFQLMLFSVFIFARWPEVQVVKTAFFWAKTGEIDSATFSRSNLPAIMAKLKSLSFKILSDFETGTFKATPSVQACKWCGARDICKDRM